VSVPLIVLGDRVLIEPIAQPTVTESGIVLVETLPPEQMGTVRRIGHGPACPDCGAVCASEVQVSDVVVFPPSAGQELVIEGTRYVLVRADEVLGVVEVNV
jgi:chaperonin GroES